MGCKNVRKQISKSISIDSQYVQYKFKPGDNLKWLWAIES